MDDFEDQIAEARRIVTNPASYLDKPWFFRGAWETLKLERGQDFDEKRLGVPAYLVASPTVVPIQPSFRSVGEIIEPHRLAVIAKVRARLAAERAARDGEGRA